MKRIPELDAIRGLAAISVVLLHAFPSTFYWGWSCVDLFFVLSGYLITTIILTEHGRDGFLRSFYLRRMSRIWPVYFLTLGVVVIINGFSRVGYPTDGLGLHLVFLQHTSEYFGFPPQPFIHSFGPSWSVAIEEQFYVVWPLLLLMIGRSGIPWVAGVLLTVCLVCRSFMPDSFYLLFTRGDGLALGCFLAWLLQINGVAVPFKRTLFALRAAALLGGGYVIVYLIVFWGYPWPGWRQTCFTGFGLLFFSLIGSCVCYSGARALRPLRSPVLRWFGTISYALYLFHQPVFQYSPRILESVGIGSPTVRTCLTWVLIVVLPAISWYCIERPILGLRDRRRRADKVECTLVVQPPMQQRVRGGPRVAVRS